jgi:signal transduction histidine kinase/ActR/RegA family two-component response regulator
MTSDGDGMRVLILAPVGRDGPASAEVLRKLGIRAEVCASLADLVSNLETDVGGVLLAEEALFGGPFHELATAVKDQPAWSDLPFIVLTTRQQQPAVIAWRQRLLTILRNVSLLDRPVTTITLASSIQSALKARRRQYEVRMYLAEHEQAAQELELLVAARTSELAAANIELRAQIAKREIAEASLRQSQKMEAVGQLTGGIAHDFNNMLQAISSSLELMHRRVGQGRAAETGRYVDSARRTVDRASALTNRLLAFARRQALQPRPVDLDGLITGIGELVRGTVGPAITVELRLDGLWPVLCDPNQLESALLNIAINARDAMPKGGRLTIGTRHVVFRQSDLAGDDGGYWDGASPGDYVEIAVADTGSGMEDSTRERAFEPFFTTKPVGQGTGLGLSQLYGFVRQSSGFVRLDSQLGHGTTVRVCLPRHGNPAAEMVRRGNDIQPEQAAAPRIVLLVEDEADVRATAAELLGELGHQVLEAVDGPSALRLLTRTAHVDLLVTDVGLPNGLNGLQVADAAREHWPDLPVLFITGYVDDALNAELAPGMQVIGKPFRLDVLAARIAAMLRTPADMQAL